MPFDRPSGISTPDCSAISYRPWKVPCIECVSSCTASFAVVSPFASPSARPSGIAMPASCAAVMAASSSGVISWTDSLSPVHSIFVDPSWLVAIWYAVRLPAQYLAIWSDRLRPSAHCCPISANSSGALSWLIVTNIWCQVFAASVPMDCSVLIRSGPSSSPYSAMTAAISSLYCVMPSVWDCRFATISSTVMSSPPLNASHRLSFWFRVFLMLL